MIVSLSRCDVHRPGPQPANQIGTLLQQLALARTPRPSAPAPTARLLDLLAEPIADIALAVYRELDR